MIHTDGIRTIANAPVRTFQGSAYSLDPRDAGALVEVIERGIAHVSGLAVRVRFRDGSTAYRLDRFIVDGDNDDAGAIDHRRGPAPNGQQWNDDRCICGGKILDSPSGTRCWDCFNYDPEGDS